MARLRPAYLIRHAWYFQMRRPARPIIILLYYHWARLATSVRALVCMMSVIRHLENLNRAVQCQGAHLCLRLGSLQHKPMPLGIRGSLSSAITDSCLPRSNSSRTFKQVPQLLDRAFASTLDQLSV